MGLDEFDSRELKNRMEAYDEASKNHLLRWKIHCRHTTVSFLTRQKNETKRRKSEEWTFLLPVEKIFRIFCVSELCSKLINASTESKERGSIFAHWKKLDQVRPQHLKSVFFSQTKGK
jgi:hypothetical protein